jgi:hypothetical protein
MPPWLKYAIVFVFGWLFGAGVLTIVGVANAFQAFVSSLMH